jgi:hypothetical protein
MMSWDFYLKGRNKLLNAAAALTVLPCGLTHRFLAAGFLRPHYRDSIDESPQRF